MKTKFKSIFHAAYHSFGGTIYVGAVLLIASNAQAQNLFVAGCWSDTITEITPGGVTSTFASGLSQPEGLAFNSAGDLFEADSDSGNIYEFTPDGARSTFASGLSPYGLAFNSAGDLFEADVASGNIYEFTPDGARSTFASGLSSPIGLAFNSAGNLFVTEESGNIIEITPGGVQSTFASGLGDYPWGLAFDSAGNLFVADLATGSIYEFTPDGMKSAFASGLIWPAELAFDSAGDLFEADGGSGNIYEFTPDGAQSTFASGLDNPVGLAFQGGPLPVPGLPTITSINVGPAGGGNLTMSIQGTGFGTTNGILNATTNLIVCDINPVTGATNWTAGRAVDWDTINITSWTDNEIDIANLNFSPFTSDHFSTNDQITIQVQNPQTQGGWSSPYALTLPPGYLVLEIQAPTTGYPLVVSDNEFANLVNPILQQLRQEGLVQPNSTAIAAAVAPNPIPILGGPKFDLAVVDFLLGLQTDVGEPLSDLEQIGGWWVAGEIAANEGSRFIPLPTSPPEIALDVAGEVLYYSQQAQEFIFWQPRILCYSFPMTGQSDQIENLDYFVCNSGDLSSGYYLKVVIPLSALPQSPIDLRWILGNWGWGVAYDKKCGQITDVESIPCDNGLNNGLRVLEYSYNFSVITNSSWGEPSFSAHVIDGIGNPVSATVPVPTGQPDYTIITSNSPAGSGTTSGGDFAYSNSIVAVTATPNSCFSFQNWTENGVYLTNSPTYTFIATSNRNLTANFVTNIYTVTTVSSPSDGGTTAGTATVACGDSVTLVASNNPGYSFAGWTWNGNWITNSSTLTFTVSANSNLVANFSPLGSSIITTVSSPPSGGSTTGGGTYTNGVTATVAASAANCYSFVGWTTNGVSFNSSLTNTITVETNQVFVANFAPISYNIAVSASAGGTTSGGGFYNCGAAVTFHATPNPCYSLVNWTENGSAVSGLSDFFFVVDTNHNFVANFALITNSINTSSLPANEGSTGGGGTVGCQASVTVIAVANNGYSFVYWTENGVIVSTSSNYTFSAWGNQSLVANFVPNVPLLGFGFPLWSANGLDLILQGPIGSNYEIDVSTDLLIWLPYTNFPLTSSPFYFSVPAATNANQGFYRAVMP